MSVLRNWKLLCTAKHPKHPDSPVTWFSQQVKAVYIYLLLELENSQKTTAIPFEIAILSHDANTHPKWHHVGQHQANNLSHVSYNLAAPLSLFSPQWYICNLSSLFLTRIRKQCGCRGEKSSSKTDCLFLKCKQASCLAKTVREQSVLASSG